MAEYSAGIKDAARRQENRVIYGAADQKDVDSPAYECPSYLRQRDDVDLMVAVAGGTKTMRLEKETFLPKHPMEQEIRYDKRLGIAVAFNALGRTIRGLTGMIFRRSPVLSDDMDTAIAEATDNIDQRGHDLAVFWRHVAESALRDGHTWVHIEAPKSGEARTKAEAKRKNVRPYWVHVNKAQAINWRVSLRDGQPMLTLFVYHEGGTEPDGLFGQRTLRRIRVLREISPGTVRGELWQFDDGDDGKRWVKIEDYPIAASRVPVVFVPAEPSTSFETDPPLRDLAYEQVEHYRVRSERQMSMTFSSIAVPYLFGEGVVDHDGNVQVRWGPDNMLGLNDPDAKAGFMEADGNGLTATKEELNEIEARMAALGLQMLVRRGGPGVSDNSRTTATSDIMRKSESDASLVLFANALEAAANEALEVMASYSSAAPKPGTITINRDFHAQLIDPALLKHLLEMVASDQLSLETLWSLLIEGEVLPEDFEPTEERDRIAAEVADRLAETERMMDREPTQRFVIERDENGSMIGARTG